jgi:hypothetical protein
MDVVLILCVCLTNVVCFILGAKVGQMAARGEPVSVSVPNPISAAIERKERKEEMEEVNREREKIDTILENIDNYDGTPFGQKDVPGR